MENQPFEPNGLSAKSFSECLKEPENFSISEEPLLPLKVQQTISSDASLFDIGLHYEYAKTLEDAGNFHLFSSVWKPPHN
ncbi:MAG: hypothetical protein GY817_05545 [bacterium]|nr:hypothetical protein [bacterium]